MRWNDWHGTMNWFGWTLMIVWWGAIVVGLIWLIRSAVRDRGAPSARQLLDRRFAAGEITTEEYHERRRVLG